MLTDCHIWFKLNPGITSVVEFASGRLPFIAISGEWLFFSFSWKENRHGPFADEDRFADSAFLLEEGAEVAG